MAQWTGRYSGSHIGIAIVDIDDQEDGRNGVAYMFPDDAPSGASLAEFHILDKLAKTRVKAVVHTLSPQHDFVPRERLPELYPNLIFPATADASLEWDRSRLKIEWTTEIGTHGKATLSRRGGQKSKIKPKDEVTNWDQFKTHILKLPPSQFIFRGQSDPHRLVTRFHRTNRSNVLRFITEDIPALHRHLSARTTHIFNLNNPTENGAFYNLVQHHGYPTPLLDWTYSPFVAAYFAYRYPSHDERGNVRIYMFDAKAWSSEWRQFQKLAPSMPHFSLLHFLPIENARSLPQQAISSITNVEDIEAYLTSCEKAKKKTYLFAIDLPRVERAKVMHELRLMGITAASLFPGLDGVCEDLRDRNFVEQIPATKPRPRAERVS